MYLPPARCHLRRRCASGPPRRPHSHGGTLLHAAPEPRGLVWGRPMGPPAPCPAAPGRLRARGPRAPRADPCVTGTPERAGRRAVGAPRVPGQGPWSVPRGPPLSSLFYFLQLPPKKQEGAGLGSKRGEARTFGDGQSEARRKARAKGKALVEAASPPASGRRERKRKDLGETKAI